MTATETKTQYETIIGLEVHVQLATESKAFCADAVQFGSEPNTHTSVISLAHPGTLPRANKRQIEFATRLGLALGCKINERSFFDRKNYFYADLPKGYQITQDRTPICVGGALEINFIDPKTQKPTTKIIKIHHIHMEEDAGKSIHDQDPSVSFIDLNRAGTPLLEIVTMPDLRSGEEVDAFMTGMRHLVRWVGVSDGNMEEGSMRCDVNISIRPEGSTEFMTRCEVKNVNSMRFARQAIKYEATRQQSIVEKGGQVEQNTLNFDPTTGRTTPLRSKENAHDYRYFPDPDLPPVVITPSFLEKIKSEMPLLPKEARQILMEQYGLPEYDTNFLTEEIAVFNYAQSFLSQVAPTQYKAVSNLIINKILPAANELKIELTDFPLTISQLSDFLNLIETGKVSNSAAYQNLFPALLDTPSVSATEMAEKLNLFQNSDTDFLEKIVQEVIEKNPQKVAEYRKGKKGLLGFFMGEVMKASKGKAEPKTTNALVLKALES
ncbi:MAG: Asp-tRNA(Asn)/Glu-tRNA(Gln) amidotransferase subunit GatB [Saprospiraceae bacterium]|nr:Asp-tRNA(Asn)/Glu-tRNA(Gln) amidotransferase subunit GatB [Saprospiraceae bacterium]